MITNYEVSVYSGDTFKLSLTGLGSLSGLTKIYFSIKRNKSDADRLSIVQIELTDGLKYIKAAAAGTPGNGYIIVVDESAGDLLVYLHADESNKLAGGIYYCDVKVIENDTDVFTKLQGKVRVLSGITKATS